MNGCVTAAEDATRPLARMLVQEEGGETNEFELVLRVRQVQGVRRLYAWVTPRT